MNYRKTSLKSSSAQTDQVDNDRIFSGDLWCKYHAIEFYSNLLKHLKENLGRHNSWWEFAAEVLRTSEVAELYDSLLDKQERQEMAANGRSFRQDPPELEQGDAIAEILDYLYKSPAHRRQLKENLLQLLRQRGEEIRALLEKSVKNGKKTPGSAVTATTESNLQPKFQEIEELFGLSKDENRILLFLYLNFSGFWDVDDVFTNRRYSKSNQSLSKLSQALDIPEREVSKLLSTKGRLRRFGMLEAGGIEIEDAFQDFLSGLSDTPLCDRFYTRFEDQALPWEMHGRLAEQEGKNLVRMIAGKNPNRGQHILLYGLPGTGKTAFAQSLAGKLGKDLYFINQADFDNESRRDSRAGCGFRFAGLEVANLRLNPEKVIICIDECDKMLANAGPAAPFFKMFGFPMDRDGESKGRLNACLDSLKLTVIWIANSPRDSIDPSSRRRFDYNVYFDSLSAMTRRFIWDNVMKRYGVEERLSEEFLADVCKRYPVNAGGIDTAIRNAASIIRQDPQADFAEDVMTGLRAHCDILNIVDDPSGNQPARDYCLDGLNLKTALPLERIIQATQNFLRQSNLPGANADSPRMNLLLYGPPGTGKTEFVKYLATQLNRPLTTKMAADLLDCYIGGTEQRIVNAFREATAEKSILFIDEGDAMLSTRAKAVRTWETSQVVTLLHQMEHFKGIFLIASNFAQNLDPPALRRFTFRVHFDFLDPKGKLHFYQSFFAYLKLPPLTAEETKTLSAIQNLTPGDFRTIRQQFFYLADYDLDNTEIIKALQEEVNTKQEHALNSGFNQQSRIGFTLL